MSFRDYIKLVKRNIGKIVIIMVMTMILGFGFSALRNKTPFSTTILLSIGVKDTSNTASNSSTYEDVQAADQFTETVHGWFKNPQFLAALTNEKTYVPENFSVRKQEKQNLVVTYDSYNEESSAQTSTMIKNFIEGQLTTYNQKTNSHFELAIYAAATEAKKSLLLILMMLGLVGGFILGSIISYCYEYLR